MQSQHIQPSIQKLKDITSVHLNIPRLVKEWSKLTSNSSPGIISEELQIQQSTTTTRPPTQDLVPTSLLLVAMRERNMNMFEREIILGQFLQAENVGILRRILRPRTFFNQRCSNLGSKISLCERTHHKTNAIIPWRIHHLQDMSQSSAQRIKEGRIIPSKIRCVERSTVTWYPASMSALHVVGVTVCQIS